jgi:hypothetical protein
VELAKESSGRTERVRALDNAAIRLFEQCFSDGSLLPGDQAEIADILINGWASGFFSQNRAVVHPIPAKAKGFEWLALVLKGEHHIDEAWKARGGGYANTVSAEGWRAFSEHLGEARASLTEAWKLHPQLPLAPARMVYVAMGNSGAEEMRLWFDRATAAQIDHPGAWSSMRWGLRPRWHGSHETMLALGIAAVDTKRFDTDVPRKFFDVITDIESELKLPRGDRIFGRSDIWPHVQRMYEGYIAEPTVGSVRDGWRSTYAVVAYFAGKYGVAREQLEKLNWAPWPYNLTGWNAELSLMPLEVAARTGALAKDVAKAESRYKAGDSAAALKLYADLNQEESGDERTKRFIQHRLGSLRLEDRLLKQEWVEFLPSADNDPTWVISRGKVRRLEDRGLEVETGDDGSLLYSRARVGPNFEVKGEFEVVSSSNGEFQAGLVMGLPESFSSEWYAFRMKRNKTEGEIASFSRQWTRTQVSKSVGLNDKHNTFRLRLQGGKADAWLNEKQILWKAAPSKSMRLYKDCLLGLGAYHDMNTTVVRYKNVQVRRLPGPESAPDGQEPD